MSSEFTPSQAVLRFAYIQRRLTPRLQAEFMPCLFVAVNGIEAGLLRYVCGRIGDVVRRQAGTVHVARRTLCRLAAWLDYYDLDRRLLGIWGQNFTSTDSRTVRSVP